jgi:galactitol-specific phosphotransferase system IIC component
VLDQLSVTTIPAAVGAAMALGRDDPMWGTLVVLVANVIMLVVASTTTLEVQRRSRRRRNAQALAPSGR